MVRSYDIWSFVASINLYDCADFVSRSWEASSRRLAGKTGAQSDLGLALRSVAYGCEAREGVVSLAGHVAYSWYIRLSW